MRHQALFSSKDKSKKLKCRLLQFLFSPLRVKMYMGWMDDLRFCVVFKSISVISGRWVDDNGRLCAMEPRLQLRKFHLEWGSNLGPLD